MPAVDARRRFKIRGARLSIRYLLGHLDAPAELAALLEEIAASGIDAGDVVRIGTENLERMRAGRTDLLPYEVL